MNCWWMSLSTEPCRKKYGQNKEGREGETDRNRGTVGRMLPGSPHVPWQAVGSEAGQCKERSTKSPNSVKDTSE
ncbi:unnamed protein product [Darwinula stevensoni]|uniref:Uncharacterized protein n=1 Tax=Darwinula stevensoni TaxID=69355 RepID=A0A7R9FR29_9CRUS|nr:unnamed protein product [Darwinula stevensoni]CAG0900514.1 unnamed protein product [Darwinula stevensoni]